MIRMIIIVFICFFGCAQSYPPEFLLQHPDVLQQEFMKCRNTNSSYCDQVIETSQKFTQLSNELQYHGESFGKKILEAQEKLISLKEKFDSTESGQNEKEYKAQLEYVRELLAVVGAVSSPN